MSKYHSRKTEIDGIMFDSKREANRYCELKLMERAGEIKDLRRQVRYEINQPYEIAGKKIKGIYYVADFVYYDNEKCEPVIEDVKGVRTDVYKIKKKLFESKYKIQIREV
jgi:hypothetical protein